MRTWYYTLPDHWTSGLINDDWTGYDEEEHLTILNFIKEELIGMAIVDVSQDTQFVKYHDAYNYGVPASNCLVFTCEEV